MEVEGWGVVEVIFGEVVGVEGVEVGKGGGEKENL